MAAPTQVVRINDPGRTNVSPAPTTGLVIGFASSGTADTVTSIANPNTLATTFDQGPMPEAAAKMLQVAGGPVLCLRTATSVAGVNSVVSQTGGGPVVTVGGVPNDKYDAKITIVAGGVLGTATFKYSLDSDNTESETITVPGGGAFLIPNTGVTATFVVGTHEAGTTHEFTSTPPMYNASDLSTAFAAILADPTEFAFIVFAGEAADAASAATLFSAIDGHLTSLENGFRYVRSMMSAGDDTFGNVKTSFAAVESDRISPVFSTGRLSSAKPFAGWASASVPLVQHAASRAASALISTDLARVLSGAIDGTLSIGHDEFLDPQGLDDARISTFRTLPGRAGFFITNMRLKSALGSDFRYWQHGRVIDVTCRQTVISQQTLLSKGIRVNADGTIDEREAVAIEADINGALEAVLVSPLNAEGNPGHISRTADDPPLYTIDRTNDILATEEIKSSVAVRPLGYPKLITTDIGFA